MMNIDDMMGKLTVRLGRAEFALNVDEYEDAKKAVAASKQLWFEFAAEVERMQSENLELKERLKKAVEELEEERILIKIGDVE